jgi:hypothetical protein
MASQAAPGRKTSPVFGVAILPWPAVVVEVIRGGGAAAGGEIEARISSLYLAGEPSLSAMPDSHLGIVPVSEEPLSLISASRLAPVAKPRRGMRLFGGVQQVDLAECHGMK